MLTWVIDTRGPDLNTDPMLPLFYSLKNAARKLKVQMHVDEPVTVRFVVDDGQVVCCVCVVVWSCCNLCVCLLSCVCMSAVGSVRSCTNTAAFVAAAVLFCCWLP